jgi:hypothetical protein
MGIKIGMYDIKICRVGQNQNHIHTIFLAGKSSNIRSDTVYTYSSGQPSKYDILQACKHVTSFKFPAAQTFVDVSLSYSHRKKHEI